MADQGLLNGRLLQSAAMDCTVHCSRLYGPLQRTIQSAAGDDIIKLTHMEALYRNSMQIGDGIRRVSCDAAFEGGDTVIADMFTQLDYMEKRGSPSGTTFCRQLF